jgi:hypothetical protein
MQPQSSYLLDCLVGNYCRHPLHIVDWKVDSLADLVFEYFEGIAGMFAVAMLGDVRDRARFTSLCLEGNPNSQGKAK